MVKGKVIFTTTTPPQGGVANEGAAPLTPLFSLTLKKYYYKYIFTPQKIFRKKTMLYSDEKQKVSMTLFIEPYLWQMVVW